MKRLPLLLLLSVVSAAVALAAAACSKSDTSPTTTTTSSCSVTLGSATTSVSAAATSGTMAVTAASTCAWTAVSSASFVTVTSGASGTGNGSVGYSIAANTGGARSASIVVNGTAVVFTQAAVVLSAPSGCSVTLSTTSAKANSGGGTVNVDVTAASNCSWTATSNSSFLTTSLSATGNGTVVITAAANTGAARSGTVTIGGQTVTISQDPGIFAGFNMFDPSQTSGATNVCQIRSATGASTTCSLQSTSFTTGAAAIASYAWTIQYTNTTVKVISATSSVSSLSFTDTCGSTQSTDEGALNPLDVTLVVTDTAGNSATAKSGGGNQPKLFVQLFNCGK